MATLCGSTRFFSAYMEAYKQLTKQGWLVYSCGVYGKSYHAADPNTPTEDEWATVKALHYYKIHQSDCIVLINTKLHLGESTRLEIEFAKDLGKSILQFESNDAYSGEITGVFIAEWRKRPQRMNFNTFLQPEDWETFSSRNPNVWKS